jgi:RimJ/RimL family protein N-acetyltransferase
MTVASNAKIALRRAMPNDRMRLYHWIARNDLAVAATAEVPAFELRVPTFDEFRARHGEHFFTGRQPLAGRALIISAGGDDVGFVTYRNINLIKNVVELDVWLAGRRFQHRGLGSAALALACEWLQREFGVDGFLVRPSRRNVHGLRAARRAGFREMEGDPASIRQSLRLAPGEHADEVLLSRSLPPPRATLERDDSRNFVFLDSEFTNLRVPTLMSVGAVSTDRTAFYCELQGWPEDEASEFVRTTVVPLLDGDAVPLSMAREAFSTWLAERGRDRPVTIVSDSGYDRNSLMSLLGAEELPQNVAWRRVPVPYEFLDAVVAQLGLRRHHALDDARGLRHVLVPSR